MANTQIPCKPHTYHPAGGLVTLTTWCAHPAWSVTAGLHRVQLKDTATFTVKGGQVHERHRRSVAAYAAGEYKELSTLR